ncbi:phosphopentomutase [Deltaproteobacteria bacterium]|nr:phosphopentomutase [Deltaproteobacteria bacterium]
MRTVVLVVADSVGVGAMPDAANYGDSGSDTLGHIAETQRLHLPNLAAMGLASIRPIFGVPPAATIHGGFGKMATAGAGKDTIAGHWEIAGCTVNTPFTTYYEGFPAELMAAYEVATGEGWLGNVAASGTEIIQRLGDEHARTRKPIVYTSADSVFQVAAHEDVIPLSRLYEICEASFEVVKRWGVARVIARPFVGTSGAYVRTENRKDIALQPPRDTIMDRLAAAGVPTVSIGKIKSIYGDRGFSRAVKAGNNATITQAIIDEIVASKGGLIFANLVDFDMLYGHRRDPAGYAAALNALDARVPEMLSGLRADDLFLLCADHGNDPTFPGSDHTREYVPVLAWRPGIGRVDLGTRVSLADIGATAAEWLGIAPVEGESFAAVLR